MPFDLVSLRPSDTPEYLTEAWLGCIQYLLRNPDAIRAFQSDTGNKWQPGYTALEQMIDKACGADEAFVKAFIMWANENVWGPMDGGSV